MRVLPAIDLREGACVQLVGGDFSNEKVRLEKPLEVARNFSEVGFKALHVVDLDAAMGVGDNRDVLEALCQMPGLVVQVGGGVRDEKTVERLIGLGASRVVVGTRAVEDAAWLEKVAFAWPGRLVLASDVRGRQVLTRGWKHDAGLSVDQLLERVQGLPLAAVLVTAVHVEGQLQGTDIPLFRAVVSSARVPVIASGGVTSEDDLSALAEAGVDEAVVGMALYAGQLDAARVVERFSKI